MNRLWLLVVFICLATSLLAQGQPTPAQPAQPQAAKDAPRPPQASPAEEEEEEAEEEPVYVRRISIGVSVGGNPWYLIGGNSVNKATTTPPLDTTAETNPKDHYVFGGGLVNIALLEKWALNLGVLYRTAEFEHTQTLLAGADNPNTIKDERTTTTIKDATKSRLLDFPILIRPPAAGTAPSPIAVVLL